MKRVIKALSQECSDASRGKLIFTFVWGTLLHWGIPPLALILIFRKIDHYLPSLSIFSPYNYILGTGAIILGIIWTVASVLDQWRIGKGTFVSNRYPTRELVIEGSYRYCRNPMYLGYLFLFAGIGFIFNSIGIIFGLLPLIIIWVVIYCRAIEERVLLMKFGNRYEEYRKKTPLLFPIPVGFFPSVFQQDGKRDQ